MKPIQIECSNPDAFQDSITVTVTDGYITLECDDVYGTSDVTVTLMKQLDPEEGDPPAVTSTEFDILANRIGQLSSLETTDKTNLVSAVNELSEHITNVEYDSFIRYHKTKTSGSVATNFTITGGTYQVYLIHGQKGIIASVTENNGNALQYVSLANTDANKLTFSPVSSKTFTVSVPAYTKIWIYSPGTFTVT
jgi:hypothetical protein